MKHEVLALFLLSACVTEEPGPAEVAEPAEVAYAPAPGGKCTWTDCGLNSPLLTDGFSHEFNLDGDPNAEGFSILGFYKGSNKYKLNVVNGKITATLELGMVNAPRFLSGDALETGYIRLERVAPDGSISHRRITIDSVANITDYWARRTGLEAKQKIETYKFHYATENSVPFGISTYICKNGQNTATPGANVQQMPLNHGLVFEGDRYNKEALTLKTENTRWFNIGCAETALAKMHLTGHTRAAIVDGYPSVKLDRQAFLKMITASYCPNSDQFTVTGQPLYWTINDGSMIAPDLPKRLEARWDENGAVCLNIPRVKENWSTAAIEAFGDDVDVAISKDCGVIPYCFNNTDDYYVSSYNPI